MLKYKGAFYDSTGETGTDIQIRQRKRQVIYNDIKDLEDQKCIEMSNSS